MTPLAMMAVVDVTGRPYLDRDELGLAHLRQLHGLPAEHR